MLSLLSEVNAAVWEHSCVRQLYRNTLTDFAQAFQNDQNNISDAVNELFRLIAQSHYFFMRLEEFIRKMRFHLPLFALTLFRTSQKKSKVKGFLFKIWRFHHSQGTANVQLYELYTHYFTL